MSSLQRKVALGTPYKLSSEEIPAFLDFWRLFQKARTTRRPRIEIALRRFNFAHERVAPEDELIDHLISFEALLLKQTERQELDYRLALRGSALLAENREQRKVVFDQLRMAYRERSNIVHGGTVRNVIRVGGDTLKFSDFVICVEEHLRSAIKGFLAQSVAKTEAEIIAALDEKILGGF